MSEASEIRLILTSADAPDARTMGGKAAALARLGRGGLPVPGWFVIAHLAFDASLTAEQRAALAADTSPAWLGEVQPGPQVVEQIERALAELGVAEGPVAVRSSGVDEDGQSHSFAGQFESYLNVAAADVPRRVADVWRSAFSERVLAYRREHGLALPPGPPAVLVQRMVDAEAAGVAFSADPVSGRRGVAVVSAVRGLGDALVDGGADGDTWHVDRMGGAIARRCGDDPALSDAQAQAVADLARRAAEQFGRPQDIEWALKGEALFLLQSRPITTLGQLADPDGQVRIWDNANIAESYSGITTPLTFSFARRAYEEVYRQFCMIMGVPGRAVDDSGNTFRHMLGLVRGRVYYNLLNWYRVLALLPGFAANRQFMEQMMGVRQGLPEAIVAELGEATWRQRVGDRARLARTVMGLVGNHFMLRRKIARFYDRLNDALRPPDPPLARMRLDELAEAYRQLERRLLTRWDAPLINDFFAMIFFGVLGKLTRRWCNDADGTLHNDLLCGEGDIVSTEPAHRISAMARLLADDAALVDVLCEAEAPAALRALRDHAPLREAFDAYVARFGDRCMEELKLESPTLLDDPLPLLRAIGQTARRQAKQDAPATGVAEQMRRDAEQRVAGALGRNPWRRGVFRWVLRQTRHRVRDRENLRFERTRLFGRVRRIFVELGQRLHGEGMLDAPRDVFYLEVEEAMGFVEGSVTCDHLAGLARLRRERFEQYREMPAPADRFQTCGAVYLGNTFVDEEAAAPADADAQTLQGIGCCPGIVRGRVRVIRDPRGAALEQGEILVAERTDPGWIMLFPAAAGVLVERGSLLSHSAIVAREMGIPAIVSVPSLMQTLRDGEWVQMNGATGQVQRIAAPDAGPPVVEQEAATP